MKRGSSIGAPHVVQIAMGCDGQPILPFLCEELEGEPKYRRHIERAGRSGPRCGGAEHGARRPRAERGNLKAPEVTQLNYRLTTKLHKAKVCNAPRLPGAMRSRGRNEGADHRHRQLRARRERPRSRRAAEQRYELAPPHAGHQDSSTLPPPVGLPHAQPAPERPASPWATLSMNIFLRFGTIAEAFR